MAETAAAHAPDANAAEHGSHVKTYMRVFVTLAVFTAIEYFYAQIFKDSFGLLVVGLMAIAAFKASLVGLYFMHVKFEGRWIYYMLIPACILAMVLVVALCPDIAMQPEEIEYDPGDDAVTAAPMEPGPRLAANR